MLVKDEGITAGAVDALFAFDNLPDGIKRKCVAHHAQQPLQGRRIDRGIQLDRRLVRRGVIIHARGELLACCELLGVFGWNQVLSMWLWLEVVHGIREEEGALRVEKRDEGHIGIKQLLDRSEERRVGKE